MKKVWIVFVVVLSVFFHGCETGEPKKSDMPTKKEPKVPLESYMEFEDDGTLESDDKIYLSPKERIEKLLGDDFISMTYTKDQRGAFVLRHQYRNIKDLEYYTIGYDTVMYDHTITSFSDETELKYVFPLSNGKIVYITTDQIDPYGNAKLVIYDYEREWEMGIAYLERFYDMGSAYLSDDEHYVMTSDPFYFIDISDPYNPYEAMPHNTY